MYFKVQNLTVASKTWEGLASPASVLPSHATVPSVLLLLVFQLFEPVRHLAPMGAGKAVSLAYVALFFPSNYYLILSTTCSGRAFLPDYYST